MIEFNDEKYGNVRIYESTDTNLEYPSNLMIADIIGRRDLKIKKVELLKNRHGSTEDYDTKQFILNYKIEEEIFDLIISRFEILDL